MIDTLSALDSIQMPGTIRTLPYAWAEDDAWKDQVMRPRKGAGQHSDNRGQRHPDPQYQLPEDAAAAAAEIARDGCPSCVFPD